MRLINNLIIVDLKNPHGEFLLINGLYGYVDVIQKEEYCMIRDWIQKKVFTVDDFNRELIEKLTKRKYIMDIKEENEQKERLISHLKEKMNKAKGKHNSACFVITYGCNFACPYCYEKDIKNSKIITKEMVDKVFALNGKLEYVSLFGGEPLLPSNRDIIEYIMQKAPNASYSAITNGYFLHEFFDLFKKVKVSNIQVTLDGTESKHNKTRQLVNGAPTYKKIIAGIQEYVQNDIPITIRMNVSPDNLADCVEEKLVLENTDWGKKVNFELQPLFQCTRHIQEAIYQNLFINDNVKGTTPNRILKKLLPISDFLYNGTRLKPILKACDRDGQTRFYDALGDIYNCILAVGDKRKSIGRYYPTFHLKEKSFDTRDITTIEKCTTCKYALFCGGGCPNGLSPDVDVYTPNCENFFYDLKYIVPVAYKYRKI